MPSAYTRYRASLLRLALFSAIMQFCGYNCASSMGVANVFTFQVKNMPNSIPVLDASGNQARTKGSKAVVSMPLHWLWDPTAAAAAITSFAIQFSVLRPSLTCAINSVNNSGSPEEPEEMKPEQRTEGTPCGYATTITIFSLPLSEWICNLMSSQDTLRLKFSLAVLFFLWQLFFSSLFLVLSCLPCV